ncbi:hypothetical protein LSCM1_04486 [Leishmania martiniquensis]|uniref:Uncharacterized protein n=1 Tax=Leishmania martiniquensis TaxID=1580590 RepID=A0A836GTV2_9TRYP|nr:hypothetical protein LSCM1_04486 [Leishmania martiniquensis]
MSGMSLEAPPPLTNWGLVLDGEVRHDTLNGGSCSAAQQSPKRRPARIAARDGSVTSCAVEGTLREVNARSRCRPDGSCGVVLDDWERSAIDLYREIRRHRGEGTKRPGNGVNSRESTQAGCLLDVSDNVLPSTYASLLGTAFSHLLGGPFSLPRQVPPSFASDNTAAPLPPLSSPLLLHYFLSIGYPLRSPCRGGTASASYAAALVAAAEETAAWFEGSSVAVEDTALSRIAAPVHYFGAHLLPDVVQQMVAAHRMPPATAAVWLLRVYVRLLVPQEAKEYRTQGAIAAAHGFESDLPDPGLAPVFCMEGLWHWANAMCAAVYHLQTCAQPAIGAGLDESETLSCDSVRRRLSEKTVSQPPTQAFTGGHGSSHAEWRLFALTVLQQTTALLLRGCFNTAAAGVPDASPGAKCTETCEKDVVCAQSPSTLASETVMPAVPTSRVVVEGLACFALLVRLHARFPTQGELQRSSGSAHTRAEAQAMAEKHWEGHAQLAVRQLPHLPPHYHHLVHLMDFVLTG